MSFLSNVQSDKCPGTINGNPLAGLSERVCIQATKIFDACIKQIQMQNYTVTLDKPLNKGACVTFISARSTNTHGNLSSLTVDRIADRAGCGRIQTTVGIPIEVLYTDTNGAENVVTGTINVTQDVIMYVPSPSIMPYRILAEVSAVCAEGTFDSQGTCVSVNACITIILKVAIDVELLIPTYGYCAIPPAQDYSKEVCAGFFELPLYPSTKNTPK